MPALLREGTSGGSVNKPTLKLSGDINETITKFPYQKEFSDLNTLQIAKTGRDPVYLTAYSEEWNSNPQKVEKDFIVKTEWTNSREYLEAGKETKLNVTVIVEKDADYVMISVPIPAGCSYSSKPQSWLQGEVHREYDVHETRIYCERMKAGTYNYSIALTPRYKGTYTLNPAKAEWMYFPVKFGRNSLSETIIR